MRKSPFKSTTVLAVCQGGQMVMASDGQVTLDKVVIKHTARKLHFLYGGRVLAGFAGGTADALTLFERFERKLEQHSGDLVRSAVELAKDWRADRSLHRLEAMLLVADTRRQLIISGAGDVIEPDDGVAAIGSGGPYAKAAALALKRHSSLSAEAIAREAMSIAAAECIYTNSSITLEVLKG